MLVRMLALVCLVSSTASVHADAKKKPNIIVVITDDQGYGDLSCHGNPILKTPNIDKLYARSVRFTDFNVSPTCAPTRASLFTGRHEFRSGVTHTINERERLSLSAFTLSQLLKAVGYINGIFGKWHLGDEAAYRPERRGFDEVFIHGTGGIGQTFPGSSGDAPGNKYFDPAILHNGSFEKTKGYCTDIFFDQALKWIDGRRGEKQPFFCWIATNAPHAPLVCKKEDEAKYEGKVPADVAKFFGMISNIDDNVGKLLAKLKEWNLEEDTIVIFMTDNGGTAGVPIFNAGMRGSKVTPYLGGTRVPFFVSWPGHLPKGVDVDRLTAHVDVFPTLAELTGAEIPKDAKLDGRSLVPLLKNRNAEWADRTLFTHVGRWPKGKAAESKYANCSVRTTQFQMVRVLDKKQIGDWQLFDVKADPGEKRNVIDKHPEFAKRLQAEYDRWWDDVQPNLVNEDVVPPKYNAFHELYWKQFGK